MPPPEHSFVTTGGVLLETSLGSLTIDLYGADCPSTTGNFVNLCRAKFWNGAVAVEVIPDVALFFSHASDSVYDEAISALIAGKATEASAASSPSSSSSALTSSDAAGMPLTNSFWSLVPSHPASRQALLRQQQAAVDELHHSKHRTCQGIWLSPSNIAHPTTGTTKGADAKGSGATFAPTPPAQSPGSLGRKGLLIVEATSARPRSPPSTVPASHELFRFGITLGARAMDFLESQYVAIGEVREGVRVLEQLRRAPYSSASDSGAKGASLVVSDAPRWPRPLRMIRVKHATVLPTAGATRYHLGHRFSPAVLEEEQAKLFSSRTSSSSSAHHQQNSNHNHQLQQHQRLYQLRQRQLTRALDEAGVFTHWASAEAVKAANRCLVRAALRASMTYQYTGPTLPLSESGGAAAALRVETNALHPKAEPMVVLPLSVRNRLGGGRADQRRQRDGTANKNEHVEEEEEDADTDEVVSLEYNAHYTDGYLSSDEELGEDDGTATRRTSVKELEARRRAAVQLHQEKANETLSLMLNVLNGVADVAEELKPPENVLFVCKLNPATTSDGLAMCFSQFGTVLSADVIIDKATKQSLCYGFVEFETVEACYRAFQKMDQALVDDCRIHVDFSQSVSKLWAQKQREMASSRKRPRLS